MLKKAVTFSNDHNQKLLLNNYTMLRIITILILLPITLFSQNNNSIIENEYFKISIDSVQFNETTSGDTINLEITFGNIEGKILQIMNSNLSDIVVSEQYTNTVSLGTDSSIILLDDWKTYTSQWKNLRLSSNGNFKISRIKQDNRKLLPGFSESDLKGYLVSKEMLDYKELMSDETFKKNNRNYWIDTNNIIIKISGKDTLNKPIIFYLNFILPQWC